VSEVILYISVCLDGFIAALKEEVLIPSISPFVKTKLEQPSKLGKRICSIGISMNQRTFEK